MDKMATGKGFRRGTRQGRGHEGAVSLRVWRDAGLGWLEGGQRNVRKAHLSPADRVSDQRAC
jgi:hypothetical protein